MPTRNIETDDQTTETLIGGLIGKTIVVGRQTTPAGWAGQKMSSALTYIKSRLLPAR